MSAPSDIIYYHHAFFQHVGSRPREPAAPKRQSASQRKLTSFSEMHLAELSADMYDELQRRLHPERFPPGPLAPRNDIHWKRNDARKHVGLLPKERFEDICRDLVNEQERRYPELRTLPPLSVDTPQPGLSDRRRNASVTSAHSTQSSDVYAFPLSASPRENGQGDSTFGSTLRSMDSRDQADTAEAVNDNTKRSASPPNLHIQSVAESKIEPQKTQIVESDDETDSDEDRDDVYDGYNNNDDEEESTSPASKTHNRDVSEASGRTSYVTTEDMPTQSSMRDVDEPHEPRTYERRSTGSARRSTTREASIIAGSHSDVERLSARIQELEMENEQHRSRVDHLEKNQADPAMEKTLEDQRNVTEQVRREAAQFLEEMRALTQQHERQVDRADTMDAEAKHWKRRYNKLLTELEAVRKQHVNTAIEQPQLSVIPTEWRSSTGAVVEKQLRHYMGAISALVACVHSDKGKHREALELLHAVVLASRAITQSKDTLIPKAANLLITVVRNFAVSKGLMPLIIVDSACSDLTMAVIDFCSKQKVRMDKDSVGSQAPLMQTQGNRQDQPQGNSHKKNKSSVSFQFDEKRNRELPQVPSTAGTARGGNVATDRSPGPYAGLDSNGQREREQIRSPVSQHQSLSYTPSEQSQPSTTAEAEVQPPPRSQSRPPSQARSQTQSRPLSRLQTPAPATSETQSESASAPEAAQASEHQSLGHAQSQPRSESRTQSRPQSLVPSQSRSEDTPASTLSPSTPTSARSSGSGKFRPVQGPQMPLDSSIQSLQNYLEEQTSGTVDAIGALLAGIKNNVVAGELKPRVGQIQELVGQMIDASNTAITQTRNRLLKERGGLIVDSLKDCLARMDMLLDEELEAIRNDAKPNRHLKQRLAGVSFDMAKSTKELVKTVEEATLKEELDGIGRQLH